MSLPARRVLYFATLLAIMVVAGWAGTDAAWEAVLGEDAGRSMAVFWDLQVETWVTAPLVVGALDVVYGLGRDPDGRWAFAYRGRRAHVLWYLGLVVLTGVCAAEGPVGDVLRPLLGNDVGTSIAHYLRRALEAPLTALGIMAFLDLVRPGGLVLRPATRVRTAGRGR